MFLIKQGKETWQHKVFVLTCCPFNINKYTPCSTGLLCNQLMVYQIYTKYLVHFTTGRFYFHRSLLYESHALSSILPLFCFISCNMIILLVFFFYSTASYCPVFAFHTCQSCLNSSQVERLLSFCLLVLTYRCLTL